MNKIVKSPAVRKSLYLVGAAVIALLVAYGFISQEVAPLWLQLLEAVVGSGQLSLAATNTPRPVQAEEEDEITTPFDTGEVR